MILTVASGKGGTGKTLVSTSLALSLQHSENVCFLDCDVEEPNAAIFLRPQIEVSETVTIPVPNVDKSKCTHCGLCTEVCAYNAIAALPEHTLVFSELCHGCGACTYFCPAGAITEEGRECGTVDRGTSGNLRFVQGKLNVGEAMPSPVIRRVKKNTVKEGVTIIDAPPGTSCPVVETLKDSDFCLLVTEPTPFGLNDLELAVETVRLLDIPCGVVLNRAGSGEEGVADYCNRESLPLLLRIPLDLEIAKLYSRGITLAEGMPEWRDTFVAMYEVIREKANERARRSQR